MLWKCCTQCASKFGKLNSGHRTGKGQFSLQYQRKAMPKNSQTTAQLHSSHMLVKLCSKFSKPDFNIKPLKFQMFKLALEKAEEPEIKFPMSVGLLKKQEISRNTCISGLLTIAKSLIYGSPQTLETSVKDGNTRPLDLPLEKYVCRWRSNRTGHGTTDWFKIGKGLY